MLQIDILLPQANLKLLSLVLVYLLLLDEGVQVVELYLSGFHFYLLLFVSLELLLHLFEDFLRYLFIRLLFGAFLLIVVFLSESKILEAALVFCFLFFGVYRGSHISK